MWNPFSKNSKGVRNGTLNSMTSTQLHLKIAEVRDDTLVLKTGGVRAVLKTTSINFNLKSEDEQNAIIAAYQRFLNSLEFPVQIVVRSKKLDLDNYIEALQKKGEKQANLLLQRQTFEYIDFIRKLIEYADIMEKEFYVVVPVDPVRARKPNFVQKFWGRMHPADKVGDILKRHQEFDQLKKQLMQNVNIVTSGLENCGLKVEPLTTHQLVNLFYQIYNPITSRYEKLDNEEGLRVESDESLGRP